MKNNGIEALTMQLPTYGKSHVVEGVRRVSAADLERAGRENAIDGVLAAPPKKQKKKSLIKIFLIF